MEKLYNAVCWIAFGIVLVFGIPLLLLRAIGSVWALASLLDHSPLPWWERVLAAAALIAGFAYLFSRNRRHRIPPNQNFAYYKPKRQAEQPGTSPEATER